MKILYGVVGEGMGHAIRSRVIVEHLLAQGHELEIVASGRAASFLSQAFGHVRNIHGLHMIYEENRVRFGKTLVSNMISGTRGAPQNVTAYFELLGRFRPERVITDFESWSYLFAKAHRLPVLSLDNMQLINRCTHAPELLAGAESEFQLAKAFVKSKLPFCDAYYVTTFVAPPVRKPHTFLFPPILRPEILRARRAQGDHLLVYQSAEGYDGLLPALHASGLECRVYGMRRSIAQEQREGKVRFLPFSEEAFVHDLASCRGVVAGGGFTLMGEAVYLGKPMLALPLGRQFEQMLNARYLQFAGFGTNGEQLDPAQALPKFLQDLPRHHEALAHYKQDGNQLVLAAVDRFLDDTLETPT